ncbi:uncharacterized protein LOC143827568 [Paroedura picta]|uniref:uncharacterized protein LOC143827568 n=1 Tax=Paroedura picta TaxID=143630 RepID=UPI004057BCE9
MWKREFLSPHRTVGFCSLRRSDGRRHRRQETELVLKQLFPLSCNYLSSVRFTKRSAACCVGKTFSGKGPPRSGDLSPSMTLHNMTWVRYPSHSSTSFEDIISSQSIISRFMHCYFALFVPPGLLAGIGILVVFIKTCARGTSENLNAPFLAHALSSLLMILFSFTVTARPDYQEVSFLECGTLSFFFNLAYFGSQYLVVLMMLGVYLERHPPQNALITKAHQNPMVSIGFVLVWAFCTALIVVALLGIENYHARTSCQLDPLFAWPEYEIIKFTFGFGVPSASHLFCFILLLVKRPRPAAHPPRPNAHAHLTAVVVAITMFVGRLFYNVSLLSRTALKMQRSIGTPQNELVMNIAEITLFAESCVGLVLVLFLHTPYRSGFFSFIRNITKVCRKRRAGSRSHEMPETQS